MEEKPFLCRYEHRGAEWGFEVMATDRTDAEARLQAIARTGSVDGQLIMRIPAVVPAAVPNLITRFANWLRMA